MSFLTNDKLEAYPTMHIEVEQKFRVASFLVLETKLQSLSVTLQPAITQVDSYFAHPPHQPRARRLSR